MCFPAEEVGSPAGAECTVSGEIDASSRSTARRVRAVREALLVAVAALLQHGGCDHKAGVANVGTSGSGRPSVFVTLLPQKYFVERVAGPRFDVQVLISQGSSEHQYDPSPQQVVALGKASAYFQIGVISENKILE